MTEAAAGASEAADEASEVAADAPSDTPTTTPAAAPYRVVSLGGGPGFELLAVRAFVALHLPSVALELRSLDLEASWRPCAEGLGIEFSEWDVNDGDGLMAAVGEGVERIDLAIISCEQRMSPLHRGSLNPTQDHYHPHTCARTHT